MAEDTAAEDEQGRAHRAGRCGRRDLRVFAHPGGDRLDDRDRDAVARLRLVEDRVGEAAGLDSSRPPICVNAYRSSCASAHSQRSSARARSDVSGPRPSM